MCALGNTADNNILWVYTLQLSHIILSCMNPNFGMSSWHCCIKITWCWNKFANMCHYQNTWFSLVGHWLTLESCSWVFPAETSFFLSRALLLLKKKNLYWSLIVYNQSYSFFSICILKYEISHNLRLWLSDIISRLWFLFFAKKVQISLATSIWRSGEC